MPVREPVAVGDLVLVPVGVEDSLADDETDGDPEPEGVIEDDAPRESVAVGDADTVDVGVIEFEPEGLTVEVPVRVPEGVSVTDAVGVLLEVNDGEVVGVTLDVPLVVGVTLGLAPLGNVVVGVADTVLEGVALAESESDVVPVPVAVPLPVTVGEVDDVCVGESLKLFDGESDSCGVIDGVLDGLAPLDNEDVGVGV